MVAPGVKSNRLRNLTPCTLRGRSVANEWEALLTTTRCVGLLGRAMQGRANGRADAWLIKFTDDIPDEDLEAACETTGAVSPHSSLTVFW